MLPYQSSIGIEIRDDEIVLVHLIKTLKGARVQSYLVLPVTFPLTPETENEVVNDLKRFFGGIRVSSEKIVVGLPMKSVMLKLIKIPSLTEQNLPQLLGFEVEKHIPFEIEEVYYDYNVAEKDSENLYRIILAAVKKDIVDSIRDLFERVPLRPKIFDISSFGIFNALVFKNGFSEDRIEGIVFLGSGEVELEVIQGGILRYSRVFDIGDGDSFIERLSKELEIALSGIDTRGKEKKIGRIILSGPGATRPGIIESIKETITADTVMYDFSEKVAMGKIDIQLKHSLIPAIGLALREIGEAQLKFNFLPHEPAVRIGKKALAFAIILACIVFLSGLGSLVSPVIKDVIEIKKVKKKIKTVRAQAEAVERVQSEIKRIEDRKKIMDMFKGEDLNKLDMVYELARIIPDDAWLISLDYTESAEQKGGKEVSGKIKRELILSGFSSSASKLIPLLDNSPIFENVEFIGPITSGVDGKERFRIKALAKRAELKAEVAKEGVPKREVPNEAVPKAEVQKKEIQDNGSVKDDTIQEQTLQPQPQPTARPRLPIPRSFRKR